MSTANQTALEPQLKALEQFARCLADGLRNRVEGEVQDPSVTLGSTNLAAVLNEAPGGALLGRASIGADGATAGLLWVSGAQALLSAAPDNLTELNADDVRTLNDALQACCEETGEEPPPVEWSTLEPVGAEEAAGALRELGILEECEHARVSVRAGESEFVIHFVAASEDEGAGQETDDPGTVADEPAEQQTSEDAGVDECSHESEPTLPDDSLAASPEIGGDTAPSDAGQTDPDASEEELPEDLSNLRHLLDVRIPLTIRLGTTRMTLEDILRISKGTIVELQQREEEPLEVLANGRVIARGEVVVVDDRFGLRITEIGDPAERVRATR